jgi:glycosyltransferase involved in cell wall biosynthesis
MLSIAVCGKFHYPKYLTQLDACNALGKFYCSYKLGATFGLPSKKVYNAFLKEYAINLHLRAAGYRGLPRMLPFYHAVWEQQVIKEFNPTSVNLFMIHGNCGKLIQKARLQKKIVIGEAVNAHPDFQNEILKEEHSRRKLKFVSNEAVSEKMLEEFMSLDRLLVPSGFVKRTFESAGFDPSKIVTIPYGVDRLLPSGPDHRTDRRAVGNVVKILCVGQIIPRKGQYYLVDAIKSLNKKSVATRFELTLVGRGDAAYIAGLERLGVDFKRIEHIKNEEMVSFMSEYDIFANPTLEDGFGIVVCEALAAGLPVITTTNAGAADIIDDGGNGVIIDPANSEEIVRAVERILDEAISGSSKALPTWDGYARTLAVFVTEEVTRRRI